MNSKESNIEETLLLTYLLGQCTPVEQERIEAWLDESDANKELLDRLEVLWVETGKVNPSPVAVDVEEAWRKMTSRLNYELRITMYAPESRFQIKLKWVLGIASVITLLIGFHTIYRWMNQPQKQLELFTSGIVKTDTLPDGSLITLRPGSKLYYPEKFSENFREVKLKGSGFFQVEHDSVKPFIVDAGAAKVKVLGTSFEVNAFKDSAVEVVVKTGRVLFFKVNSVTGDTSSVILTGGNEGILPAKSLVPFLVENNKPDELFWFDRTLEFRNTPLSQVFRILEKQFTVHVSVENEEISRCLLTATFANDPVDKILEIIALSFELKITHSDNTYYLSGNGCKKGDK